MTRPAAAGSARGPVQPGGFAAAGPVAVQPRPRAEPEAKPASEVEILFKPKPAYTDEARQLRIEGIVLLEVLFSRSGEVQVLRLVQGLGHGLDQNAIEAARKLRFKPAQRDGQAVDSRAAVQIQFELAY